MTSYRISTYDPGDGPHDPWGWRVRHCGLPLMALRAPLREFRDPGYDDDLSILIEREEGARP